MPPMSLLLAACGLLPPLLMLAALPRRSAVTPTAAWGRFRVLASAALACTALGLVLQLAGVRVPEATVPGLGFTLNGQWVAVLVQLLGMTIGVFSSRYLQGEPGQPRYVGALAGVLAAVQVLLLADHWLVLIAAWAAIGLVLRRLLCFYRDRPFALLAAHKKRVADRGADLLLIAAAALAWNAVGSGAWPALWRHLEAGAPSFALQASAVCLALAVVLRTALLPVHGWLIQVMEAPTPVSALLHAGVVNLGGFVLIRFAPLLEAVPAARWLLVVAGVVTACLAGLVMLTRISIKVRLAWSTVAQMGFMVMECGLGLYGLALLHLIGHSVYKAHTFLAASGIVEETRLRAMRSVAAPAVASVLIAPVLAVAVTAALAALWPWAAWPLWWSGVLGLAWAPLLWWPAERWPEAPGAGRLLLGGVATVAVLVLAALVGHGMPFGVHDVPYTPAGVTALAALAALYAGLALMRTRPAALAAWRRRSYAGFYVDEFVTRAALRLWPTRWAAAAPANSHEPGNT
ncbi:NADH-quinone oxidoreductase subunit L [uncultured Xylophilus sp.]|uniref:NADH-quinone oxidoreductase subunit L n=1 Tax=uncultured Xylophilus sp. TaxID=296832 RepID=UPI0025EA62B6|nr:NADH-quinone oxidoreductase subunit L [uncultured Xylophilus sp.]